MDGILLGGILGPIASLLGNIMNGIYLFFNMFGVENIALSIIVFTFITKTLMLPLTFKQQKFSKLQSRITPEIQKIQAKYKGKKDEVSVRKQQEETQAIYKKYGASPTAGCLPLLISMPILFALFRVINNIPEHVDLVRNLYETVALGIQNHEGGVAVLTDIASNFDATAEYTLDNIITILASFNPTQWAELLKVGLAEAANGAINTINGVVNNFIGLSITDRPFWKSYSIIIPILSTALQFLQTKMMTVKSANKNDAPNPTSSMNAIMPIISGVLCYTLPIGVGIYWISNSLFAIIQQFFVNKHLDHMNIDELVEKSQEKAKNKIYKNTKHEPVGSIKNIAKTQTKAIESVSDNPKEIKKNIKKESDSNDTSNDISSDNNKKNANNPSSISDIANILRNSNKEKEEK